MERKERIQFRHLAWDSYFFGRKIGSLRCIAPYSEAQIRAEIAQRKAESYELIYLILEDDEVHVLPFDPGCDHLLVDVKYTFGCNLDSALNVDTQGVTRYTGEAEPLFGLALQAGEHSRYRLDGHFREGEFARFYRTWVINSLNGQVADKLFITGEATHPTGFVTLKMDGQEASIGLIAVDESTRGQGLGQRLVARCLAEAQAKGCKSLKVATQQQNEQACNFYRRCGMELVARSTIIHCWL